MSQAKCPYGDPSAPSSPSVSNHHWNLVIVTLCFTASAKDLFCCFLFKVPLSTFDCREGKVKLFTLSAAVCQSSHSKHHYCYTLRWKNQHGGLAEWPLPVLAWLSTLKQLALKCFLCHELIFVLCSVCLFFVFFTGCACLNLSDPWPCSSHWSIYCDNRTCRGHGPTEAEILTRLMKWENLLINSFALVVFFWP